MAVDLGGMSGGAFNSAVGILSLASGKKGVVWVYWVGPMLGSFVAAVFFRMQNFIGDVVPDDECEPTRPSLMAHAIYSQVSGVFHAFHTGALEHPDVYHQQRISNGRGSGGAAAVSASSGTATTNVNAV